MVQVVADNAEVRILIQQIADMVVGGGGYLHPEARLVERAGALSIEAPSTLAPREILVRVPLSLLLPVDWYDLKLDGDQIDIGVPNDRATKEQLTLMETMAALFNATGGVSQHRTRSLLDVRKNKPELFALFAGVDEAGLHSWPDDVLSDFLGTRTLAVAPEQLQTEGDGTIDVLMPVIDFLNHEPRAGSYSLVEGSLASVRGHPAPSDDECFLCYGRYDARALLVKFAYEHTDLPFLFSCPLTFDLKSDAKLIIARGGTPMFGEQIPPHFSDVGWIMPEIGRSNELGITRLSYLPILQQDGQSTMRRILDLAVQVSLENLSESERTKLVRRLEREIVERNLDCLGKLQSSLADSSSDFVSNEMKAAMTRVTENQIDILMQSSAEFRESGSVGTIS